MKNTYVDTDQVTSKGLELPGVQEIWTMKLQLVSVTRNHLVQVICSSRPMVGGWDVS